MTPTSDLSEMTTIVVGASRGLGRGITTAFAEAGAPFVSVARTSAPLADHAAGGGSIQPEVADASDPTVAGRLLDRYQPTAVILVAGASPLLRPLQHQTWETFSVNWHTDVRIAFHWLREALLRPLRPGSRVVVITSGAAVTDLGRPAVKAYAARTGQTEEEYVLQFGEPLTLELVGAALLELVGTDADTVAPAYLLTGTGLQKLP